MPNALLQSMHKVRGAACVGLPAFSHRAADRCGDKQADRWRGIAAAALLALASLGMPAPAEAWSRHGHALIGDLAEAALSDPVRAAARGLLADDGGTSLGDIASWADDVRANDPAYAWSTPLHWVNHPRGLCRYDAARDCPDDACVVAAIERFHRELADRSLPTAQRREALKFLVHFVGDIHQPLHAGFGHDLGGNRYQINVDGVGSNLHRYWDGGLLGSRRLSRTEHLALLQAMPAPEPGTKDPVHWAEESCRIVAQPDFYPKARRLRGSYTDQFLPIAEQRVRLAGQRLAALLESALAEPGP